MKRFVILLLVIAGLQFGWKHLSGSVPMLSGYPTDAEIKAIATDVRAGEVTIYTTSECPYCAQAKGWLARYGFAFTECNLSFDSNCQVLLRDYGADGVPLIVIRRGGKEYLMKGGFDSEEFLMAVRT